MNNKNKAELLKEIDQLKLKIAELESNNKGLIHIKKSKEPIKKAIEESDENYKQIFEGVSDGIVYVDKKSNIVDVNPAFTKITGIPGNKIIGKSGIELAKKYTSKNKIEGILKLIKESLINKTNKSYEIKSKDQTLEITSKSLKNGYRVAVIRDITVRKQSENALLQSENRLRFLAENAQDMIYRMSVPDGIYEYINSAAFQITGYTPQEHYDSPILIRKIIHPDWRDYFENEWKSLIDGKMSTSYEYQIIHKSGKTKWLNQRNALIKDENGKVVAIEGIVSDITQSKLDQEAILQSEIKYRSLFEKSADAMLIIEKNKIIDCNFASLEMFGYKDKHDILDSHPSKISPKFQDDGSKSIEKADEMMDIAYRSGNHRFEWIHKRMNGELFPAEVLLTVVTIGENKTLNVVLRDVTDRKKIEQELLKSEKQYRSYFEKDISGVFLSTPQGKIIDFNPAFAKMLGYTSDEIHGINTRQLYPHPRDRKKFLNRLSKNKTLINLELDLVKKNGQIIHCIENVIGEFNSKGELVRFRGYMMEITNRKQSELELKEREQKLRNIFENSSNIFYAHTPDHILKYLSPQVKEILGYTEEEALVNWTNLASDNPINEIGYQYTLKAIETGEKQPPYNLELVKKTGEKVWVEVREAPIVKNGKTELIVGALIDITERMNSEKALLKRERILTESQVVSNLGSYELDIETGFWEGSEMLLKLFGIDKAYKTNIETWVNAIHPDDREMMQAYFTVNILKNHELFNKAYRIVRLNDKAVRWMMGLGRLEFDLYGKPTKMIGTIQDITERKLVEEALVESETKYRSLIENSNDAVYLIYEDKFEVINNKFTEMFGYTIDELNKSGFGYPHLVAPKSKQFFKKRLEQFSKGKIASNKYEITLRTRNGKEVEVEVSDTFINYKKGIANQGFIRDITARKKQQEVLMNAIVNVQEDEKYKFGKELHDGLGQVLVSESMYLESLGKIKHELDDNKKRDLEQARLLNKKAIIDTRRISHGLMITGIDSHGIIHLIKQLCYNSGGPEIIFRFTHNGVEEQKISNEYKMHIYRIVQELSTNILKHSGATEVLVKLTMQNHTLKLIVSDNGSGFEVENTSRGAGLPNIDQRITIMKGEKNIQTKKGEGTKFTITIPV